MLLNWFLSKWNGWSNIIVLCDIPLFLDYIEAIPSEYDVNDTLLKKGCKSAPYHAYTVSTADPKVGLNHCLVNNTVNGYDHNIRNKKTTFCGFKTSIYFVAMLLMYVMYYEKNIMVT